MSTITDLEYVIKYFNETFNDDVLYYNDMEDSQFVIVTEKPVLELDRSTCMYAYNEQNKTFNSFFDHTFKMLNANFDMSKSSESFIEHWKNHYLMNYNFPKQLYKTLEKVLGPNKKLVDNFYSISMELKEIDNKPMLVHQVIFAINNGTDGTHSFIVFLDEQLNLTDIKLYDATNIFIRHSTNLTLVEKHNLFHCVLGSLTNLEFSTYFNKSNIDYSERSVELLRILQF